MEAEAEEEEQQQQNEMTPSVVVQDSSSKKYWLSGPSCCVCRCVVVCGWLLSYKMMFLLVHV